MFLKGKILSMKFPENNVYQSTIKEFPQLKKVVFNGKIHFREIIANNDNALLKMKINNDFSEWKTVINNKTTTLRVSFCLLYFYKNFDDNEVVKELDDGTIRFFPNFEKDSFHSKLMFDMYVQSFFQTYYSIIDISKQIVSLILNLEIKNNSKFNIEFTKKTKGTVFSKIYKQFNTANKDYSEIRNNLQHNFPITDINCLVQEKDGNYGFGGYSYINSNDLFKAILEMTENLIEFISKLEENINSDLIK